MFWCFDFLLLSWIVLGELHILVRYVFHEVFEYILLLKDRNSPKWATFSPEVILCCLLYFESEPCYLGDSDHEPLWIVVYLRTMAIWVRKIVLSKQTLEQFVCVRRRAVAAVLNWCRCEPVPFQYLGCLHGPMAGFPWYFIPPLTSSCFWSIRSHLAGNRDRIKHVWILHWTLPSVPASASLCSYDIALVPSA